VNGIHAVPAEGRRPAEPWGRVREYEQAAEVVLMAGSLPGTVIRRVRDTMQGVPRYSVRTHDGIRVADVNGMRPALSDRASERQQG
jgi:hypothetical protein